MKQGYHILAVIKCGLHNRYKHIITTQEYHFAAAAMAGREQGSQYHSKFRGIPDISVLSAGSDIFLPAEIDFLNICFTKK